MVPTSDHLFTGFTRKLHSIDEVREELRSLKGHVEGVMCLMNTSGGGGGDSF